MINEFNKIGSDVEHFRVESEEKQAADEAIKARIDELIERLEIDNKQGKQPTSDTVSKVFLITPLSNIALVLNHHMCLLVSI